MGQETVDSDTGDERRRVPVTTEKPYTGIAHLAHENGKAIGTGFLVKHGGRTFLVTAAHCLWDERKGAFRAKILISLGRDGEHHPFATIKKKAVDFEVPREYKETRGRKYDYGIIRLDKKKDKLNKCCAFDLEPRTDEYIESQDLYMSGYPGIPKEQKAGVPGWPPGTQWNIKLTTVTVNERSLQYRDATTPGNSGSPVYEMKDDRYVAHGIHTNGIDKENTSNAAVLIDADALMKLVKTAKTHKKQQSHPQNRRGVDTKTSSKDNMLQNKPQPTSPSNKTDQNRPQDSPTVQEGSEVTMSSWIQAIFDFTWGGAKAIFDFAWGGLKAILGFAWLGVKAVGGAVCKAVKAVGGAVCKTATAVGGAVCYAAKAVGGAVCYAAKAVGGAVCKAAKAVGGALCNSAKAVSGAVCNSAKAVGGAVCNVMQSLFSRR